MSTVNLVPVLKVCKLLTKTVLLSVKKNFSGRVKLVEQPTEALVHILPSYTRSSKAEIVDSADDTI